MQMIIKQQHLYKLIILLMLVRQDLFGKIKTKGFILVVIKMKELQNGFSIKQLLYIEQQMLVVVLILQHLVVENIEDNFQTQKQLEPLLVMGRNKVVILQKQLIIGLVVPIEMLGETESLYGISLKEMKNQNIEKLLDFFNKKIQSLDLKTIQIKQCIL